MRVSDRARNLLPRELDVWVIVPYLGLDLRPFWNKVAAKRVVFSRFPNGFDTLFVGDCFCEHHVLTNFLRRILRLLLPKNVLVFSKRKNFQLLRKTPA